MLTNRVCCPGNATEPHMHEVVRHMPDRFTDTLARLEHLGGTSSGTQSILDDTVEAVARALDVPLCKVLELTDDRSELVVRSGVGWQPGVVGSARVSAGPESQPGYALALHEPVMFENLLRTSRFTAAALARQHGIISSACLRIADAERTFGVLCVHDVKVRRFSSSEVRFLRRVAELLARVLAAHPRDH